MTKDYFEERKKAVLSKKDKSSKSSWDKKIISLCNKINLNKNYYTSSSCSGRIVLIFDEDKKLPNLFLHVNHNLIDFNSFKKILEKMKSKKFNKNSRIKFKQEPCGVHVVCKTLNDAENILKKAKLCGWKKAGIISISKNIIAELMSTEKMEFVVCDKEKILVDDNFLKINLKKTNENLKKCWEKIERLEKLV
jgi:tRNA wybutosine-synthesizing protein 3